VCKSFDAALVAWRVGQVHHVRNGIIPMLFGFLGAIPGGVAGSVVIRSPDHTWETEVPAACLTEILDQHLKRQSGRKILSIVV
jgi:hypothetical protein